jgi:hypothetical protein
MLAATVSRKHRQEFCLVAAGIDAVTMKGTVGRESHTREVERGALSTRATDLRGTAAARHQ